MVQETNLERETEAKTETGMETGTRIQEISSATRTSSAMVTTGTNNRSGRTIPASALAFATGPERKEMRAEAESTEKTRESVNCSRGKGGSSSFPSLEVKR
jgi:hypothetical protein